MSATREPPFTTGTTVRARPWVNGTETRPRDGIILSAPIPPGEYLTVWFPSLGELCREQDGHAIQAIMAAKAKRTGHLGDWTLNRLRRLQKRVIRGGGHSRDVYLLSAISVAAMNISRAATAERP